MKRKYFLIISLIILSIPINYSFLFDFFRPVDVLSIVLIILTFKKWKLDLTELFLWLSFFILIIFSSFIGFQRMNYTSIVNGLGFFYKYFFIFAFLISLSALEVNQKQLKIIYNLLYIVYFFLFIWVFIYIYLVSNKMLIGSYRPSFPFSNNYQTSDAHLYANYLSLSFVFFHLTQRNFKVPLFLKIIESLFIIPAIFLTGSRNGLLILFLGIIISFLLSLANMKNLLKELLYFSRIFLFIGIILLVLSFSHLNLNLDVLINLDLLINRALTFGSDESSMGRIYKFHQALNEASHGLYFLGEGLFSRQGVWYDGIHSQIISAGGFLSFLVFLFIFLYYWNKKNVYFETKALSYTYSIMLFLYFISNFITEFVLVSRSLIPFLLYIFVLINSEKSFNKLNIKDIYEINYKLK